MDTPPNCITRLTALIASMACLGLAGCATVHEVTVDAIRDPTAIPGASYRLEVVRGAQPMADEVDEALQRHVRAALASTGAHEAPVGVAPQQVVFVEAGVGPGHRKIVYEATVEPQYRVSRKDRKQIIAYEKYLRISARESASRDSGQLGRELWSVHVSVDDESKELGPYLTILAAAVLDHVDYQAPEERVILIKENDARKAIGHVKYDGMRRPD